MKALKRAVSVVLIVANGFAQGIEQQNENQPPYILRASNSTDIWIASSLGTGVNDQKLRVGGNNDYHHSLIRFDLSPIPTSASTVTLTLFCFGNNLSSNVGMALDLVTSPWDTNTNWASAPTFTFVRNLPAPALRRAYVIDITDLVKQWQANGTPNYGLQLRPLGNARQFNDFYSTDYPYDSLKPRIDCTFPPQPRKYRLRFPLTGGDPGRLFDYGSHWLGEFCSGRRMLSTGVDIPAPIGALVRAVGDGVVTAAGPSYIALQHPTSQGPVTTIYQHIFPIRAVGATVLGGETIGAIGPHSEPMASHLRFQLRESVFGASSLVHALPEGSPCGSFAVFPDLFHDLRTVTWVFP